MIPMNWLEELWFALVIMLPFVFWLGMTFERHREEERRAALHFDRERNKIKLFDQGIHDVPPIVRIGHRTKRTAPPQSASRPKAEPSAKSESLR